MRTGEYYLTDLKERLDRKLLSDDMSPIPEEIIAHLEQALDGRRHDYALWCDGHLWYRISDILAPDERCCLAELSCRILSTPI